MSPSRLLIRKRSRVARKGETHIADYAFPPHIETRMRRRFPQLDDAGWQLVERGLREWFICCAWRGRAVLGMPSRLVDEAWHEFILDSASYMDFCQKAFGAYLHHTPDEAMSTLAGDALGETVYAWDRSGSEGDSVLWDLDRQLGVERPLGVNEVELSAIRTRASAGGGGAFGCAGGWSGSDGGGGGCGGGCGGGS